MNEHIQRFFQIIMEHASIEEKVNDLDKSMILLYSLTPSYKGLITTLCYGKNTLEFDGVLNVLRMYE